MTDRDIRNRIVEMRSVPAAELLDNRRNWRRHPAAQRDALRGILAEVGIADTLVAYRSEREGGRLTLIDGHLRHADFAVEWPTLILDVNDAEADMLLASLDPLAAMAEADSAALSALLAEVAPSDAALRAMLDGLARDNPVMQPDDREDHPEVMSRADELQAKWRCSRGQVWLCGRHRVMCGDSTDADDVARLMQGEKAGLMVTDPPYGVGYDQAPGHRNPHYSHIRRPIANDNLGEGQASFWLAAFAEAAKVLVGDAYVFASSGPLNMVLAQAIEQAGIKQHQWLVWAKDRLVLGRSHYHYRHEHIFYGWRGRSSWNGSRTEDSVWECQRPSDSPEHPTMKPVELIVRAIENSSRISDTVLDPFLGSGTTLIAAEKLGRICYGMEIHPPYVSVVLQRYLEYTGDMPRLADG